MKIGILTWGTEGDIRPFIALARGLSAVGHEVRFSFADVAFTVTPELAARSAAKAWSAVTPAHDLAAFRRVAQRLAKKKRLAARQLVIALESWLYPMEQQLFAAAEELCQECDLVVGHALLYPLAAAALKLGRPRVTVSMAPMRPSREYVLAGTSNLGGPLNRLFWWIARFGVERLFAAPARRLFRAQGLSPARSHRDEVWSSPLLNLVGVSPALFPQPTDWPAHTTLCGHLALPEERPWPMPESLQRFLAAGPPPVFMTFGSMAAGEEDAELVPSCMADAARRSGCRAIIQTDWARVVSLPAQESIYRLSSAPHDAIFPHCSAIVHHGGAGTAHAAARAGRPSVVVAHATDQLFWASTLRRAGLAAAPLQRRSLTAERLARAIRKVVDTPELTQQAGRVSEAMRLEDGVRTAVERIAAILPAPR